MSAPTSATNGTGATATRHAAALQVVAAFDFDGTLTRRDTLLPYLAIGLGWAGFGVVMLQCAPWLLAYALRLLPNHVAKARLLRLAFSGRTTAEVDGWTTRWMASLPAQLRPDALAQLAAHQRAGHCCVMVSASPDVYLQRAARQLGFDALVCTEMAVTRGVLSGNMQTPNCHGEQKVIRLRAWLAGQDWCAKDVTLHAYGDTPADQPMLRMAGHAWYRGQPWRAT